MEGKGSNTILLTVIGVATLLVALVGATFAYFSATISNNSAQSVRVTTAAAVTLQYTGGTVTIANAIPGAHEDTNAFTVTYPQATATPITTYYYDLVFVVDSNTFEKGSTTLSETQLVLTISNSQVIGATPIELNMTDGGGTAQNGTRKAGTVVPIKSHIEIVSTTAAAKVHSYNLKVEFKETGENQNENQGKTFAGHIEVRNVTSATA